MNNVNDQRSLASVVVTGGAGFIGSHLVDRLMETGTNVVVIDNLSAGKLENISQHMGQPNFTFIKADLLTSDTISESLQGCTRVCHLVGNPDVRTGYSNPVSHFEQNIVCTYNLLNAMKSSDTCKEIVFSSTSTIYGQVETIPTPENYGPLMPISLYGATKLACESLISGYCNTFGMKGVIIRLANVIGPRSNHGVLYDFIQKLKKDPSYLEILGDGTQNKSYIHVSDCVSAMLKVTSKMYSPITIFNVGSADRIKVKDIAKIVIEEMSLQAVELKFCGGLENGSGWIGDIKDMMLDVNNIEKIGWSPRYDSLSAVREAVRSMIRS